MDKSLFLLVAGTDWPMETFLERLLCGLAGNGIQVTLATSRKPDAMWLAKTGVRWISAPAWRGLTMTAMIHLIFHTLRCWIFAASDARIFLRNLPDAVWKTRLSVWYGLVPFGGKRWDVVYFPWNSAAVHYLPLFDLGMPVIVSCRGSQINVAPHNPKRQAFVSGLRTTLERASFVHCVSEDILQQAIPLGLDTNKAVVIRPAVDLAFFIPSPEIFESNETFRVVMVGSLNWVKGYEYALSAIHKLVWMGVPVECVIIGNGPEQARLRFAIEDLGLSGKVYLLGKRSPEQVREILQNSDVFLLSSLSEGISNAVLEAMACSLPVVTTDCGGMREAVTDGVEGCVVPVRDPQAIAQVLFDLWRKPSQRKKFGQAGRERACLEFSLNSQIEQFVQLFDHIAKDI